MERRITSGKNQSWFGQLAQVQHAA